MRETQLTNLKCMVKGFASGSFIMFAILFDHFWIQLLFFIFGITVFVDSITVFGANVHIFSTIIFSGAGMVVTFIFWIYSLYWVHLLGVIALTVLVYMPYIKRFYNQVV